MSATKLDLLSELHSQFIIPVIRETDPSLLEGLSLAMAEGGLRILELTLMSDSVFSVIKKLSGEKNLIIGAGTVINSDQAEQAIASGAKFLVSPGLSLDVVEVATNNEIPFFPGVLTPTEVMQARDEGCELFKIFPISVLGGASYLQALKGPFPDLKWMPTGGVSLENLKQYQTAGAHCVGMGGKLIPAEKVKAKAWSDLTSIAANHVREAQVGRS